MDSPPLSKWSKCATAPLKVIISRLYCNPPCLNFSTGATVAGWSGAGLGLGWGWSGAGLGVQGQGQGQAELGLGGQGVLGRLPDHSSR